MHRFLRHIMMGVALFMASSILAQTRVEYFWDTDPGIGKATLLKSSTEETIQLEQDLPTNSLAKGIHQLVIRAVNASVGQPYYVTRSVLVTEDKTECIQELEYYWDTDPGFGKGATIPITLSDKVELNTTLSCVGLSDGLHQLNIRARSESAWSIVYSTTVLIETIESNEVSLLEYFWDEDPGVGKGKIVAVPEGQQGTPFAIDLNTSDLSGGVHKLGLRAKAGKNWSQTEVRAFLIDTEGLVTRMEYFWDDEDPGIGNAIPLNVEPAHEIKITDLVLPLTGLSYEYHTLNIRAMSESDVWTETHKISVKNVNPEGEYSIEVTYNEGGSVSASAKRVDEGKPVSFTFTPDVGHELYKATVNGNDIMPLVVDNKYTINGVIDDIRLNAEFSLIHYDIKVSCSTGGSVSASSYNVLYGDDVTFTVTPSEGYEIESVTLNGADVTSSFNNGSYTLKGVTANQELYATFKPLVYAVHIACGSNGTVTVDSETVEYGQSVTFTITPNEGYMIEEVLCNGNVVTNKVKNGQYTVTSVQGEVYLSVTFKIAEFNISVVCGEGGNVTSSAQFVSYGENVTFIITPDDGRKIKSVILNGVDITNEVVNGQYTVYNIREHIVLTVTFSYGDIAISIFCSQGCQIQINDVMLGSGELGALIQYGSDVIIRLYPDQGYDIAFVTIDGADITSKLENNTYIIRNVTEQKNIKVVATRTSYQIEVIKSEGGTIRASSNTVIPGGSVTFTLVPNEGYEVVAVVMNGVNITDRFVNGTYTIESVRTDITIQATFALKDAINYVDTKSTTIEIVKDGIHVSFAPIGKLLNVYTTAGLPVKSIKISEENFFVNLPLNKAYIIKIDERTFKVAL